MGLADPTQSLDDELSPLGLGAVAIGVGWLTGLWVAASLDSADALPGELGVVLIGGCVGIAVLQRRMLGFALVAMALAGLVAGVLRYQPTLAPPPIDDISGLVGATATLRGVIDEEPAPTGRSVDLRIRLAEQVGAGTSAPVPVTGRMVARVPAYADYRAGDRLELSGAIVQPAARGEFSYRAYLARQGIRALMSYPQVKLVGRDEADWLTNALLVARRSTAQTLRSRVAEPAGPLAAAMILGDRSGLPRDLNANFTTVGALHIVAISGMNVALLVQFLSWLLFRPVRALPAGLVVGLQRMHRTSLGRPLVLIVIVVAIAGYAALVGPQASVVRAAVMGGLVAWARFLGRPNDALTGLAVAAIGMTAFQPEWLWDVGFQLSFVATAGLVVLTPPIERVLEAWPPWLRTGMAGNLAATVATVPILATTFGQISPASVPVTLLSVPVVGPAMLTGAGTAVAGMLWEPLAVAPAWITWGLLRWMVMVVDVFAGLPGASIETGADNLGLAMLAYSVLIAAAFGSRTLGLAPRALSVLARSADSEGVPAVPIPMRRLVLLLWLMAVAGGVWIAGLWPVERAPVVTFLDVGQGDCTLVQTPGGRVVLIDGGPDGTATAAMVGRRLPMWRRHIDVLAVTHPHEDHLAGLIEVARRLSVDVVVEPDLGPTTPLTDRWGYVLAQGGARRVRAEPGKRIDLDGEAVLEVVAAPAAGEVSSANELSVIYRVTAAGLAVLVPGDATPTEQRDLGRGLDLRADVLKVPHHGAKDSIDSEFLSRVDPMLVVISVGEGNRYGHPAQETLWQLGRLHVYRTDRNGSVEVELSGDGIRVSSQR